MTFADFVFIWGLLLGIAAGLVTGVYAVTEYIDFNQEASFPAVLTVGFAALLFWPLAVLFFVALSIFSRFRSQ